MGEPLRTMRIFLLKRKLKRLRKRLSTVCGNLYAPDFWSGEMCIQHNEYLEFEIELINEQLEMITNNNK